jgi:uncharacterized protein (DUF924 family)
MDIVTPELIDEFWFSERVRPLWFDSTPAFDDEIRDRFEETWRRAKDGGYKSWRQTALGSLALVIVFDQFPLNMYRGKPDSFSTEARAREVAEAAIERGFDLELTPQQQAFLYMPYMHSESLADQNRSVRLFDKPGLEENLKFAHHHCEIVRRFGRFPHRNAILGRASTREERDWLASDEAFLG